MKASSNPDNSQVRLLDDQALHAPQQRLRVSPRKLAWMCTHFLPLRLRLKTIPTLITGRGAH